MNDFQKSLTRFMYVALIVVAAIGVWSLLRPSGSGARGANAEGVGYGPYGRYGRGVTATGTCVVRTKPDVVEVTIGVKQSSRTANEASSYVKSRIRKITEALQAGGVEAKDIQTAHYRLEANLASTDDKWNAEEALKVKIRNVDSVSALLDEAVKAGANRVGRLQYTMDDVNALRAKGRAKAAEVARNKAEQLATSLGGKLGPLVACNETYPDEYGGYYWDDWNYGYGYYGYSRRSANVQASVEEAPSPVDASREELTIQPGQLVMNVVVTATYEVE